uniref:Uncharacterized protein n=1 Tax=Cryptomonas curvata TaxID=233186 RepID=A0A7S0MMU9_9CRYP|mmetsp:Transcript_48760/g.101803  ORF Transcript_48760/g.101803 Transcript_48760/m.101803 type:complete len:284 (+) Transcript_48760:79-930(+)|eukprot:CAMPEP_0172179754 /NCGR_PEP_ID=MMETSP1050-20130122/16806_1 /TAXON_ID=233186 /ORGANISM="Cryptomonas curvata, Strain CCAP979/52" /LENGTH=283 /DNA_ID=CAMNT_0012852697 /DNA_START=81 /DNA_END=932 /DNA_ORIENTATION=+
MKTRFPYTSASACILGFKLTLLALAIVSVQNVHRIMEQSQSQSPRAEITQRSHPLYAAEELVKHAPESSHRVLPSLASDLRGNGLADKADRQPSHELSHVSHTVSKREGKNKHDSPLKANAIKANTLAAEDADSDEETPAAPPKIAARPLSWDKSWWSLGAWILWFLSCVTPTVLIFVLNGLTQGWTCGLVYLAFLVPLDIATLYFDIYAYDTGGMYVFELTVAAAINCCLCACLLPAAAFARMESDEAPGPLPGAAYGTFGGPQAHPRPTDYGRPSEHTEYV